MRDFVSKGLLLQIGMQQQQTECILASWIKISRLFAVRTDFTNMAVMIFDLLRNLTFNRSAQCSLYSGERSVPLEALVVVPADKASNIFTFVCMKHYVDIQIRELTLQSLPGNLHTIWHIVLHQTCWTATKWSSLSSEYRHIMRSFALHLLDSEDAQKSIWTQIHYGFIEVFDQAFIHSTLKIVYTYLARSKKHCDIKRDYTTIVYSRSGINQMWILKNSKELSDHL